MLNFALQIEDWYRQNCRDLPWRQTKDPYLIWLSEVILQQTRVDQGLPYYKKFSSKYPTIDDLALADEEQILLVWQGLGYYSRARNMLQTAKYIVNNHSSEFPKNYKELLSLKGIGPYTAAAIASFAFKEATPVIDGNVYRVLTRYYGIDLAVDSKEGKKQIIELANLIINKQNPDIYNQAIMEFGALQCKPKNPNCSICPLADSCLSYAQNKVLERPLKLKKTKIVTRYFHYLVHRENDQLLIEKRTENDIWKGLFQFPLIECNETDLSDDAKNKFKIKHSSSIFTHKLTHQIIYARFHECNDSAKEIKTKAMFISTNDLENFAFPRLIQRYLEDSNFI
jgi:A/G-specific adenine glycosylase